MADHAIEPVVPDDRPEEGVESATQAVPEDDADAMSPAVPEGRPEDDVDAVSRAVPEGRPEDDVDAVTSAVLTASRLLVAISVRSLAAVGERVTLPQFRLLVVLATHEETNLVTLAERLAVNPSTAMRMVERLLAAGLVDRRTNPASRREVLLRLTESGRQIVDEVTASRREEIATIVTAMPAEHRVGLVDALRVFTDAGGEPPVGEPGRDAFPLGWD